MSARCLVVGGSGYVGSAIRARLQEEDCAVAWTCHLRTPDSIPCDLRDPESVRQAVNQAAERLGGLDAVIGSAGVSGSELYYRDISSRAIDRLQPVTQAEIDELLEINVRGAFSVCQAAAPHLKQAGRGNIVWLGAIDGLKPVPAPVHFATSQSALRGLVESLAKELGHHDICVNLLALGILEKGWADKTGPNLREAYLTHCSLKRLGTASEVAEMVAWLVVENTYLTGQMLVLDGGL